MGHIDAPKIKHIVIINEHRIEIYWDQEIHHHKLSTDYKIFKRNIPLTFIVARNKTDSNWATRPIYEPIKKRVTLYLLNSLNRKEMNQLSILITGTILNNEGKVAEKKQYSLNHWQDFYTRFTQTNYGILIKSSDCVTREAHRRASQIIDQMLIKLPNVTTQLIKYNAELAIYGHHQDVYDIPEHRGGSDILGRPAEGFGGYPSNTVTSISEANILRIIDGPNQTRYTNECILVHEFSHAIHLIGINQLEHSDLAEELTKCYMHAKACNLWPNTYIISNVEEYFATLTTIWFNVMAESESGNWDGVRGPLNKRSELKQYDPMAYNFLNKIYTTALLPHPWNHTLNHYPNALTKILN